MCRLVVTPIKGDLTFYDLALARAVEIARELGATHKRWYDIPTTNAINEVAVFLADNEEIAFFVAGQDILCVLNEPRPLKSAIKYQPVSEL